MNILFRPFNRQASLFFRLILFVAGVFVLDMNIAPWVLAASTWSAFLVRTTPASIFMSIVLTYLLARE